MALPAQVGSTDTFLTWRNATNTLTSNVLDKTLNFSDIPDAATARTNLDVPSNTEMESFILAMTLALGG